MKIRNSMMVVSNTAAATLTTMTVTPRHVHIPDIDLDNKLLFEGMAFIYSGMVLCLQYINIYKTVWWLPHSNANYALNFYLINAQLFFLLLILMSRRFCYSIFEELQKLRPGYSILYWLLHLMTLALCVYLLYWLAVCSYHVMSRYSVRNCAFLALPLVTYFILFRFDVRPLFGKISLQPPVQHKDGASSASGSCTAMPIRHRMRDIPVHTCSSSPEAVRDEVEALKTDFNSRFKQILFDSMLCAYYMGCIPFCFAQNTLYYDTWWVAQHVVLVWFSSLTLFSVHYLPTKYLNMFHRSAIHLGHWSRVEGRYTHGPCTAWSELQIWPQGALVKHVKGLFRADGFQNSAEPGNSMHSRFYFIFHRPMRVVTGLLCVTCLLIGYQFLLLVQVYDWSHIISIAFLLFTNYYSLFKLARDRIILSRSYRDDYLQN